MFIVDTASPRSLVPLSQFPSFAGSPAQCSLFAADGKPLYQAGVIDLTLQFNKFPNTYFSHHFILADVQNAILGLDFLCKYHFLSILLTSPSPFKNPSVMTSCPPYNLLTMLPVLIQTFLISFLTLLPLLLLFPNDLSSNIFLK